jgi:hypothetical protein
MNTLRRRRRVREPSLAAAGISRMTQPPEDDIARRAYTLFERRGGEHGYDVGDWLQAERELRGLDTGGADAAA